MGKVRWTNSLSVKKKERKGEKGKRRERETPFTFLKNRGKNTMEFIERGV